MADDPEKSRPALAGADGLGNNFQSEYCIPSWSKNDHTGGEQSTLKAMRNATRWLLWRSEQNPGEKKPRKVPYYVNGKRRNGKTGTPEDAAQLDSVDAAERVLADGKYSGLGFALGDGWQGIDLDELSTHLELVDVAGRLPGYVERSPSGDGLHAIGFGRSFKSLGSNGSGIEAYASGRYFTFTGKMQADGPLTCLASFVRDHLEPLHQKPRKSPDAAPEQRPPLRQDELREIMRHVPNAGCGYDDWLHVGMALHDATGGCADGYAQWVAWSALSEKHDDSQMPTKWASFRPGGGYTVATLIHLAKQNGFDLYGRRGSAAEDFADDHDSGGVEAFDLSAATVSDLLSSPPPPRYWIVEDRIPLGVVGILGAAGGTGKSIAALQLAVATCSGMEWLGMPVQRAGSVLIVSAEDDRAELHRRLWNVMDHYRDQAGKDSSKLTQRVDERLRLLDRVGDDNRLTCAVERQTMRTALAERVITTVREQLPDCVLIVLDPLARFDGGEPNDNADATRLIEVAEHIRKETGATVLLPHHVSKAGIKDPESGQEAIRGGSGLVDGARWVGMLATLRRDAATDYGIDRDDAGRFVRFTTPKANYSAPWPGMWLERLPGGVLVPTELQAVQKDRQRAKGQERYDEALPVLLDLIRRKDEVGEPIPLRRLRDYAGIGGIFGVGQKLLDTMAKRAIEEGHIVKRKLEGARHETLHVL